MSITLSRADAACSGAAVGAAVGQTVKAQVTHQGIGPVIVASLDLWVDGPTARANSRETDGGRLALHAQTHASLRIDSISLREEGSSSPIATVDPTLRLSNDDGQPVHTAEEELAHPAAYPASHGVNYFVQLSKVMTPFNLDPKKTYQVDVTVRTGGTEESLTATNSQPVNTDWAES